MVKMSNLSIVVLTYNNFDELLETLNSIPNEFLENIYIVNGGKCTKTNALIEKTYKGISEKDGGISDAFSKGVKKTTGKYIHFLNSGDKIHGQSFYQKAFELFDSNPSIDYIYTNILYKHLELGDLVVVPNKKAQRNMAFGMPFPHPGLIVKRDVFDKIGFFNDQYKIGMDYDFIMRMTGARFLGHYLDIVSVEMEGSGISSRKPLESIVENFKILKANKLLGVIEILILTYRYMRTSTSLGLKKIGISIIQKKYHQYKQARLVHKK